MIQWVTIFVLLFATCLQFSKRFGKIVTWEGRASFMHSKHALRVCFVQGVVLNCMDFRSKIWDLLRSSSQQGNTRDPRYPGCKKHCPGRCCLGFSNCLPLMLVKCCIFIQFILLSFVFKCLSWPTKLIFQPINMSFETLIRKVGFIWREGGEWNPSSERNRLRPVRLAL